VDGALGVAPGWEAVQAGTIVRIAKYNTTKANRIRIVSPFVQNLSMIKFPLH
jgi:hypothetical protein